MLGMVQDLHSAISLPALTNATGTPYPVPTGTPAPSATPISAEGITFQQWSGGPFKVIANSSPMPGSQNFVHIRLTDNATTLPVVNQKLIIPTHQIEGDITAVTGAWSDLTITLANMSAPSPAPLPAPSPANGTLLPVQILGTTPGATPSAAGDVICYITDVCSYRVVQASAGPPIVYKLVWVKGSDPTVRDMVTDITNPKPFSIPVTADGALYYRFVAAIDLSTSDPKYSNRGYKAANILLNGQVPYKARLTTYQ
jgi:hypothetical protein